MSDTQALAALVAGLGTFLLGVAAYRKWGPEARKITVDTVEVNVRVAGELRDDALSDRQAAREELAVLRRDFQQYRADTDARLAELSAQLRAERAEKVAVKQENEKLRARVDELETEVTRLKSRT